MAPINDNIKRLREQVGMSQEQLAELIGKTRSAVSQYEAGKIVPRMGVIDKLAGIFGVSKSEILGESAGIVPGAIMPASSPRATAPLLGRVHAGDMTDPEVLDGEIELPYRVLASHPNAYFLEVEGDCMDKVYPEGCFILIDPEAEPQNGSVAVVSIDGADAVMRRMYRTSKTLVLSPDSHNPEHEDIIITSNTEHSVEFGGKVVWFQARKEME